MVAGVRGLGAGPYRLAKKLLALFALDFFNMGVTMAGIFCDIQRTRRISG